MTHDLMTPDPVLRLLILLARLELTTPQRQQALAVCRDIDDWTEVTRQAKQQFILPLVYRHLRRLSPSPLSTDAAAQMRHQCLSIVQENLLIRAAQQCLVSDFLEPLEIPHLFFKGPSLAARYYDEPTIRYCRDIDLLVPREHCAKLLEATLRRGYQALDPLRLNHDETSLDFALRTQSVLTIVSPHGVKLEVHTELNKGINLFPTTALLGMREPIKADGATLWVMPTADLFVYICLHHTRHYWSRLHWLVDLDAIQRHPDFSLTAAYDSADQRGLKATVEASLELYHALAAPAPANAGISSERAESLLTACLDTLRGGQASELALRKHRPTPEFAFSWQTTAAYRRYCRLRRWLTWLRPRYRDYEAWPLPPHWQWLYFFISPVRALMDRAKSAGTTS